MSMSLAAVRFPDGHIEWAGYNETGDSLYPYLFDTPDDAYAYSNMLPYVDEEYEMIALEGAVQVQVFVNGIIKFHLNHLWANRGRRLLILQRMFIPDLPKDMKVRGMPDWYREFLNKIDPLKEQADES